MPPSPRPRLPPSNLTSGGSQEEGQEHRSPAPATNLRAQGDTHVASRGARHSSTAGPRAGPQAHGSAQMRCSQRGNLRGSEHQVTASQPEPRARTGPASAHCRPLEVNRGLPQALGGIESHGVSQALRSHFLTIRSISCPRVCLTLATVTKLRGSTIEPTIPMPGPRVRMWWAGPVVG